MKKYTIIMIIGIGLLILAGPLQASEPRNSNPPSAHKGVYSDEPYAEGYYYPQAQRKQQKVQKKRHVAKQKHKSYTRRHKRNRDYDYGYRNGYGDRRYRGKRFYRRQHRQNDRIYSGYYTGDLTRREYRKLQRQQRRIDRYRQQAWADGYLSRHERWELSRLQNRASKRIYRFKNNYRYMF